MEVLRYPNPILKTPCEPIDPAAEDGLAELVRDMVATMRREEGVGLAANQVGVTKSILVYDPSEDQDSPRAICNPRIVQHSGDLVENEEGCLSFPGTYFPVPRHSSVIVEAQNIHGKPVRIEADGFHAIVLQHEIDHLNGVVILDRAAPEVRQQVLREQLST